MDVIHSFWEKRLDNNPLRSYVSHTFQSNYNQYQNKGNMAHSTKIMVGVVVIVCTLHSSSSSSYFYHQGAIFWQIPQCIYLIYLHQFSEKIRRRITSFINYHLLLVRRALKMCSWLKRDLCSNCSIEIPTKLSKIIQQLPVSYRAL